MHVAVVRTQQLFGSLKLEPGEYLVEDSNAAELLALELCTLKEPQLRSRTRPFDSRMNWNETAILFVRPGGFGDLLFLTPIFAEIKKRWPLCLIHVACFDRYREALSGNPDVDKIISYPINVDEWEQYDCHIWLEGVIEKNSAAREKHVVDLLADRLGMELEDKEIRFPIAEDVLLQAKERFPSTEKKRIGIQPYASTLVRTYPHHLMSEVCRRLLRGGNEIFLFGAPGEIEGDIRRGVTNLTALEKPLSFTESAAVLATCDACIAPDSVFCHVAGALHIPTIALYGPFPWQLRTAHAPSIHALQGVAKCAPCFHHSRVGEVFPRGEECENTGDCAALARISPSRIVSKIDSLIGGVK